MASYNSKSSWLVHTYSSIHWRDHLYSNQHNTHDIAKAAHQGMQLIHVLKVVFYTIYIEHI